jgi:hypothetical protein
MAAKNCLIKTDTLRPAWKRKLVDEMLVDWGISIRRACKVLPFDTSTYHYKSRRTDQGDLQSTCSLWLSTCARPVAPGRLDD